MQPAHTAKAPLDARSAADLLRGAFQAEVDAIHRAAPGQAKGEVYKPAQPSSTGAWARQLRPSLADGSDFLQTLAASLDKVKTA